MLASGSKGNACIIEIDGKRILIDCGTTKRYLVNSFQSLDLKFEDVDIVLITHDHSDHTSQIRHFTHAEIFSPSTHEISTNLIRPYESFNWNGIDILPIKTSHDDESSVGYVITRDDIKLVYITDTGYIRDQDLSYIKNATFYILESNHDPAMLMQTARPYHIKQRILSDEGHLSNDDAGLILSKVVGSKTRQIILAHLSLQANTEELALQTVKSHLANDAIVVKAARQFEVVIGG